jgi:hypothetical protein
MDATNNVTYKSQRWERAGRFGTVSGGFRKNISLSLNFEGQVDFKKREI